MLASEMDGPMTNSKQDKVPLKVLVCDTDIGAVESLRRALVVDAPGVLGVKRIGSTDEARSELRAGDYNTIFIDPISLGVDEASSFVFEIRQALPQIVFVLYLDRASAERNRASFTAERGSAFPTTTPSIKARPFQPSPMRWRPYLERANFDLSWRLSSTSLERLRGEVAILTNKFPQSRALLEAVDENLSA